jgi:hypothetical protein
MRSGNPRYILDLLLSVIRLLCKQPWRKQQVSNFSRPNKSVGGFCYRRTNTAPRLHQSHKKKQRFPAAPLLLRGITPF